MERRQVIAGMLGTLAGAAALPVLGWPRRRVLGAPAGRYPDVILAAFDTTRADHLGCYGYGRPTSPVLDRLARESVVFTRCTSQANETLTSFASLLTSRIPSEIAPLSYEAFCLPEDAVSLPRVLGHYGYQTGGFVAGGHLIRAFGFAHGFDTYEDRCSFGSFAHTLPAALGWLDGRDRTRPSFLFVHGYDAHAPYAKPLWFEDLFDPDYRGPMDRILGEGTPMDVEKIWQGRFYPGIQAEQVMRPLPDRAASVLHTDLFSLLALQDPADGEPLSARDLAHVTAHYDASIAYADLQFGLFLDQVRRRNLLDDSLLVVLGDHGEDLFAHGHANHRISLHDTSTHVPLIVRFPGARWAGTRVDEPVSLLDVLPTVLEEVGAMAPAGIRGRSLLRRLREGRDPDLPGVSVSEGILPMASARSGSRRLVLAPVVPGSVEFFELIATGDPGDPRVALYAPGPGRDERLSLADGAERERARALLAAMAHAYRGFSGPGVVAAPNIDPALQQAMQDKGYW